MIDEELRARYHLVCGGGLRRATLERWLIPTFAELPDDVDPATRDLAARTLRILSEREHGNWAEEQAKALLRPWVGTYLVGRAAGPLTCGTTSVVRGPIKRRRGDGLGVVVGKQLVAASG